MPVTMTQFGCAATQPQFGHTKAPQFGHAQPAPQFGHEQDTVDLAGSGDQPPPKKGLKGIVERFWDRHPGLFVKSANITNHPIWSAFP